ALQLVDLLGTPHIITSSTLVLFTGQCEDEFDCSRLCMEQVRAHVHAASADSMVRIFGDRILASLQELTKRFIPRTSYRATHGDLQPDHILVDRNREPWLIDVQFAKLFDGKFDGFVL